MYTVRLCSLILFFVLLSATDAIAACTVGTFDYCVTWTLPATVVNNQVVHFSTDYSGIAGNMSSLKTAWASAASKVQADGDDIQFFDNTGTILTQGLVDYDNATGAGWWTVRVPTSGTTEIWIRYGKAGATSVSDFTSSTGVFQDFDYVLLNGDTTDYSGNSRYGSFVGGLTTGTGKFGLGYDLDGVSDYLLSTGLNTQTDTTQAITILVRTDNEIAGTGTGERIFSWATGTNAYISMRATWGISAAVQKTQYQSATADYSTWSSGTIPVNTWHYITTAVAATTSSHTWTNGVQADTDTPNSALATRTEQLAIGALHNGSNPFDGLVNLFYLVLGGTATSYPLTGSLAENDYDYDTFFSPGTVFSVSTESTTPDPVAENQVRIRRYRVTIEAILGFIEEAATSAATICAGSGTAYDAYNVGDAVDCYAAGLGGLTGARR